MSTRRIARLAASVASLLALLLFAPATQAQILDLADIVGGGDGTGTGMEQQGIATQFGLVPTSNSSTLNPFSPVPALPFVDGVFVPDGGPLNDAIEAAHGEEAIVLDLFATHSHSSVSGGMQFPEAGSFHVFVDGAQVDSVNLQRGSNIFAFPRIYLEPSDQFVTLVTGSQGSLVADFQYWITPTLRLPEPGLGTGLLSGVGALAMASRARRRGASTPIGRATASTSPIRREQGSGIGR